ncbi:hypothetical protein MKW94_013854 [Papaver nudicaule]|uniref:Phytocyanin domain-containing protein n=1 Tax=Papaver nudicaule TaxID=74823 RepID=A0AA41VPL5_PAPNU|nr:hypothetical protein [Papaver nudicaule]
MGSSRALVFLVVMFAYLNFPLLVNGVVYSVGESTGWTTIGHYNYAKWASNQTFKVGDTIRFVYSPQHHNVMQVTSSDYESCNAMTPLATYTTGNDSIPITKEGHHYFICGIPGHCIVGQKVDIQVSNSSTSGGAMTPTMSPNSTSPSKTISSASKFSSKDLILLVVGLVVPTILLI